MSVAWPSTRAAWGAVSCASTLSPVRMRASGTAHHPKARSTGRACAGESPASGATGPRIGARGPRKERAMSKRGNQEGSIHKRSDGRWVGVLHLGYVDGKRQRKYFYGKTQRDVQAQLTAARAAQQQGQQPTNGRLTVAQYLSRWLADSA